MRRIWLGLVALSSIWAATPPGVDEIVRRSVANTQADWNAAPQYNFSERDVVYTSGRTTKSYRVTMMDGSPYYRLTGLNGKPLAPPQAAREEKKYQAELARRQSETSAERQKRIAEYKRERRQDNALMREMIHAFDFRLAGEETVNGRRCFVLDSTPRPGYQPVSRDTTVLKGMRGRMWVDEKQFQWVKVQAEVFRPVEFGLVFAQVRPGTEFTFEQQPVHGSLWLPSHFSMRVNATILKFWPHNSNDDETYWDYQPASQSVLSATASRR